MRLTALTRVRGYLKDKKDMLRKLDEVANNGYETAQDILFPGEAIESKKLHYGPVIPM